MKGSWFFPTLSIPTILSLRSAIKNGPSFFSEIGTLIFKDPRRCSTSTAKTLSRTKSSSIIVKFRDTSVMTKSLCGVYVCGGGEYGLTSRIDPESYLPFCRAFVGAVEREVDNDPDSDLQKKKVES